MIFLAVGRPARRGVPWRTPDSPVTWNSPETPAASIWRPPDVIARNSEYHNSDVRNSQSQFAFPGISSSSTGDRSSDPESQRHLAYPDIISRNSRDSISENRNSGSQNQFIISDISSRNSRDSISENTNSAFQNQFTISDARSRDSGLRSNESYPNADFGLLKKESQTHYAYSDPNSGLLNEESQRYPNHRNDKSLRHYTYPNTNSGFQNSRHYTRNRQRSTEDAESGRHLFDPENLATFSETLGAINTLGRYLVNITRSGDSVETQELPSALYTISKNVLGRNVTDTIAGALPPLVTLHPGKVTVDEKLDDDDDADRPCTMPDGRTGTCDDLSNCPQLLLDLSNLRQSICFKSLFVPGVCCPRRSATPG